MKRSDKAQRAKAAAPPSARADTAGTQAIHRAAVLLRQVAAAGQAGATLTEIARSADIARSTVHRILRCLAREGFIEHDVRDLRYRTGPLLHELGLAPGESAREIARWRPVVEAVARRTGVTAYLMRRSGLEAVCIARADGYATLRFVPVDVGQRRLLGVGGGATALLAALPPAEMNEILPHIAPGFRAYPRISEASVREAVRLARRSGFAMSQGTVVEGGFGLGAAIANGERTPHLAISIAAHASTVTESAIAAWKRVILEEIAAGQASSLPG